MIHYNISTEWPKILRVSQQIGVDPLYMVGVRIAENGRPGFDFGVKLPGANDYDSQLLGSVKTIRRFLVEFLRNPFAYVPTNTETKFRRLCYSMAFIVGCGKRYADPALDPINKNWPTNVSVEYYRFCKSGWDLTGPWPNL